MKKEYYPSLKLELGKVSYYLQKIISEILGRNIVCAAKVESNDFWGVCIVNTRLSLSDLKLLLSFVNADDRTVEETMPEDSKSTYSLGMLLSSNLLKKALNASWKEEYVTEKALWLIDVEYIVLSNTEVDSNICFVCNRAIDSRKLNPVLKQAALITTHWLICVKNTKRNTESICFGIIPFLMVNTAGFILFL